MQIVGRVNDLNCAQCRLFESQSFEFTACNLVQIQFYFWNLCFMQTHFRCTKHVLETAQYNCINTAVEAWSKAASSRITGRNTSSLTVVYAGPVQYSFLLLAEYVQFICIWTPFSASPLQLDNQIYSILWRTPAGHSHFDIHCVQSTSICTLQLTWIKLLRPLYASYRDCNNNFLYEILSHIYT